MKSRYLLLPTCSPAYRRAVNMRCDLVRAVGLYAIGDRSTIVLQTLAQGKLAYDALGKNLPRPTNVDQQQWTVILTKLVNRFGYRPYEDAPCAA